MFTIFGAGVQRLFYEDVGDREESQRDRWEYGARARVGYQLSPRIGTFVQGNYSYRYYDNEQLIDGDFAKRNSHGLAASLGTNVDITSILFGEVALTYAYRNYTDNAFNDSSGPGLNGNLTWNVTPLTSVLFNASSEILETTVIYEGDAAEANFQNQVGIEVQHELRRNILLNATADYTRDDFQGTSRKDNIFGLGAGVSYLLNRNLSLNANYVFTKRDSDDNDAEFDRNVVLVGFTARL